MSDYAYLYRQLHRTDAELYGLPHPKIVKLVGTFGILSSTIGDTGLTRLTELMRNLDYPKGELIAQAVPHFPEIRNLTRLGGIENKINMPALELFLAPLRFFANEGRIFEITQELDELLALTDIGETTPIEFFKLPFTSTYLHFTAKASSFKLTADSMASTSLMGAYITELQLKRPQEVKEAELFLRWADETGALACFEITLVGYPLKTIADHSCVFLRLYVGEKMREMPLWEVLALNFQYHKATKTYGTSQEQEQQLKDGIAHLAKTLLFINSQSVRRADFSEEHLLTERLKGLGPKKQGKLKRRLERTYDRIIVSVEPLQAQNESEGTRGPVRAHWRRGHFRHQPFGPGRTQNKLLWIRPMQVGSLQGGNEPTREYSVKTKS